MRIRTVKPEFWISESNGRLSRDARLLFVGLLNLADDGGRLRASVGFIAGALFPFDDDGRKVVSKGLVELERYGKVRLYESGGDSYAFVTGFEAHQKLDKRFPSRLPVPPDKSESPPDKMASPADFTPVPPDLSAPERNGEERRGEEQGEESEGSLVVFDHWRAVFDKQKAKFDDKRKRAVRARLAEGRSVADLKQAIDGCSKTPHNMGQNDRGEKYTDLELICRDGPHVERFMANALSPPKPATNAAKGAAWTQAGATEWTEEALNSGPYEMLKRGLK